MFFHLSLENVVTKPFHCLKLLSESNASVNVRVFYENGSETNTSEEFFYDGKGNGCVVTICKLLPESVNDKKVIRVEVEAQNSTDLSWKSRGILVQEVPGGNLFHLKLNIGLAT